MDLLKPACERCGSPAIVHITSEGGAGSGVRHLCLDCADHEDAMVRRVERGLDHAAILIVAGVMASLISIFADTLRWGEGESFGYKQVVAILLAGGGVLVGAITRIPTLYVVGVITGGLTLAADWVQFGRSPGFGWEQAAGVVIGVSLIVAGAALARRR